MPVTARAAKSAPRTPSRASVLSDPSDPSAAIDSDITRAYALPNWAYGDDPHYPYPAQVEAVFARSWQIAAQAAQVAPSNSVWPYVFAPGSLNEPMLLMRDKEGALHHLPNVCTHRGSPLCTHAQKQVSCLRCPYHGRKFELDGRFRSMPHFDQVKDFPTDDDDLQQLPVAQLGPLTFASISPRPAVSFEAWIAPVRERMDFLAWDALRYDPNRDRNFTVPAHWALYCDNYLESLHIPFIHKGLTKTLDMQQYRTECFRWCSLQVGLSAPGEPAFDLPKDHPDYGQAVGAYYFFLFPNLMLNFYPWGLSVNIVLPQGPHQTLVQFRGFVANPELLGRGAGGDLDQVEQEDEKAVIATQQGVRSRFYRRGRYSPSQEQGTHHFHQLLMSALDSHIP